MSASLLLVGCSAQDADSGPEVSSAAHNAADVAFATEMIPHHNQALQMVDMSQNLDLSKGFTQLTRQIKAAQSPEIELMSRWLKAWDEKVPETAAFGDSHGGAGGMEHDMGGSDEMPGMMSGRDLDRLSQTTDASRFESMWLTMMIDHHDGAIEMARDEVRRGEYPPAISLAKRIIASQQAEIVTMRAMVG